MTLSNKRYRDYPEFQARIKELEAVRDASRQEWLTHFTNHTASVDECREMQRRIWSEFRAGVQQAHAELNVPDFLLPEQALEETGKAEYQAVGLSQGQSLNVTLEQGATGQITFEFHQVSTFSSYQEFYDYVSYQYPILREEGWIAVEKNRAVDIQASSAS